MPLQHTQAEEERAERAVPLTTTPTQAAVLSPVLTPFTAPSLVPRVQDAAHSDAATGQHIQQRTLLRIPIALYLLLSPFTFGWLDPLGDAGLTEILLYIIVPIVMAFYLGLQSQSRPVGTRVGLLMGLASFVSLMTHATLGHHYTPPVSEQFNQLAIWLTAGAALGTSGALVSRMGRRQRPHKRTRRRLRVRLVVETIDR